MSVNKHAVNVSKLNQLSNFIRNYYSYMIILTVVAAIFVGNCGKCEYRFVCGGYRA